jgi:hypothetical protein
VTLAGRSNPWASPDGLFAGETMRPTERAARLLIDLLGQVHDAVLAAALDDDTLIADTRFVRRLDDLLASITTIRIAGEVEASREGEQKDAEETGASVSLASARNSGIEARLSAEETQERRELLRETRRGTEQAVLNFSDVARALRELAATLTSRRVWMLLDEWSSIPSQIQPYLGEFLVRCVFPMQMFTVKIAAIEQQSTFRAQRTDGSTIGIELGADVAANLNLDEYMVFERNEDKARSFFKGLLFKHLTSGVSPGDRVEGLDTETGFVSMGFTDKRAFDELVRAGDRKVSVPDVRWAARAWFQTDKEAALRSHEEASYLLNWIIDKVIKQKRARGFMVNQKATGAALLRALFDARAAQGPARLLGAGRAGQGRGLREGACRLPLPRCLPPPRSPGLVRDVDPGLAEAALGLGVALPHPLELGLERRDAPLQLE